MGEKYIVRMVVAAAVSLTLGGGVLVAPVAAQSLTDRFKSLFGGKPDAPAQPTTPNAPADGETDLFCPPVNIRPGASTFAVAVAGKQAIGNSAQRSPMRMSLGAKCRIVLLAVWVALHAAAGPVVDGVSESLVATPSHDNALTLTALAGDRRDAPVSA